MRISREEWDAPVRPGASTRTSTTYCRSSGFRMVQTISYQSKSEGFDSDHPGGVWYGKNGYMSTEPYKLSAREILNPLQVFPLAEGGDLLNPLEVLTFADLQFLHGTWDEDVKEIRWRSTDHMRIDPELSSRGLFEPTVARLSDGKTLACLCRGSNSGIP